MLSPLNKSPRIKAKRQSLAGSDRAPPRTKRIEETKQIVDRVMRANCCLQPSSPESREVLSQAVGDVNEWRNNPNLKAYRIRHKFLSNNFLQGVTEDFMSVQNLERRVDQTILVDPELFEYYEIFNP